MEGVPDLSDRNPISERQVKTLSILAESYESHTGNLDIVSAGFLNYVIGVSDANRDIGIVCFPDDLRMGAAADVVVAYINNHPAIVQRNEISASALVRDALRQTFPCKKKE